MRKNDHEVLIKDIGISTKTKYILLLLGIQTLADLYLMYVLDTIPAVKTIVKFYPETSMAFIYSEEVNEEVKALLFKYCHVQDIEHVGV